MLAWMPWILTSGKQAMLGTTIATSGTILSLVMAARAVFVFPLSNLANCFRTSPGAKIDLRKQFVIWWAGLMRGAVTIALSYNQFTSSSPKDGAFLITNSIIVVLFSTVVFGSMTKPMMQALLGQNSKSLNSDDNNVSSLDDIHLLFLENGREAESSNNHRSSLGMLLLRNPTSTIHHLWRKFDDNYMRPVFGGRCFMPHVAGSTSSSAAENNA